MMTTLQRIREHLVTTRFSVLGLFSEPGDRLAGFADGEGWWLLSLRGQLAVAFGAIATIAITVEWLFLEARDELLRYVGLEGLGVFLWLFLCLAVGLGLIWRHIADQLLDAVEAIEEFAMYTRTGQLGPALRSVSDTEALHAGLPLPTSVGHSRRLTYLTMLLECRIDRLFKYVESFRDVGILMAVQLGLLGTFIGLSRCFHHIVTTVKHLGSSGPGAFPVLAGSGLETVFSTTEAGVWVIIAVAGCSVFLWLRVHRVSGQYRLALRAAKARVVGAEVQAGDVPDASVFDLPDEGGRR